MLYWTLAWRNLWRNPRRTWITLASIAFAVLLALWVSSMNRGAHQQMIDNMSRFHTGFIQIKHAAWDDEPSLDNTLAYETGWGESLKNKEEAIEFLLPRLETFMLASGEEQVRGAVVMGVDAEAENQLNQLKGRLQAGEFFQPGDGRAVLSEGLARRLRLDVGDELVLLGQGRFATSASGLFEVAGLVRHPLQELNNQLVYLSLPDAQWLLSAEDQVTALLVTPRQLQLTESLAASLQTSLDAETYQVETWQEMLPELLATIQFDLAQQHFVLGTLYMVIGFGLFGTVLMMTLERTREFGVLVSLGMQRYRLAAVLFLETLLLSVLGVLLGFALGWPLLWYFFHHPIPLSGDMGRFLEELGMGLEPVLKFSMDMDLFVTQGLIIFTLAFVICLYPLWRVSRLDLMQAARS